MYQFLRVSIPLWFLRNIPRKTSDLPVSLVSIPLWFLRNQNLLDARSSVLAVSIPLWFLRNLYLFHPTIYLIFFVSIPLWFLRNSQELSNVTDVHMFPYHYGSYATRNAFHNEYISSTVSIPLWFLRNYTKHICGLHRLTVVSIPLWFLRNRFSLSSTLASFMSFHTTMVLTQLAGYSASYAITATVSIPLWFLRNPLYFFFLNSHSIVSIPLWFLRNSHG